MFCIKSLLLKIRGQYTDGSLTKKIIFSAFVFFALLQVIFLSYAIIQTVAIVPIVDAGDWDAARGIETAMKSGWLSDNGWDYYGNLYYRISNSAAHFGLLVTDNAFRHSEYSTEKLYHFSAMLVSMFSLIGISCLLSFVLAKSNLRRIVFFVTFNFVFFSNFSWVYWVFKVHPDVMLAFLCSLGLFLGIKYVDRKNILFVVFSGIIFGWALATKLSAATIIPFSIVFFGAVEVENKKRLFHCMLFFSVITIVYFLAGFPQNFRLKESLVMMKEVSDYNKAATFQSALAVLKYVKIETLSIVVPIFFAVFFSDRTMKISWRGIFAGIFLCAASLFYYLFTDSIIRQDHYLLPISAMLIVVFALVSVNFKVILFNKFKFAGRNKAVFAIVALALFLLSFHMLRQRNVIYSVIEENTANRNFASLVMEKVDAAQRRGLFVCVGPYVPYSRNLGHFIYSASPTEAKVDLKAVDMIVFSYWYSERFAGDNGCIEWEKIKKDWEDVRSFYRQFKGKSQITDRFGQKWVKDDFSNDLWSVWVKSK